MTVKEEEIANGPNKPKSFLWVATLLCILMGLFVAGGIIAQQSKRVPIIKASLSSSLERQPTDGFQVTLAIGVTEGFTEGLVLRFLDMDVPFGTPHLEVKRFVAKDHLQVGDNLLKAWVGPADGVHGLSLDVVLPVHYSYQVENPALEAGNPYLEILFEVPAGSALMVEGGQVNPMGEGRFNVLADASRLYRHAKREKSLEHILAVPFRLVLPGGQEVVDRLTVPITLPLARLAGLVPPDYLAVRGSLTEISGQVDPGAVVLLDGQPVELDADGHFLESVRLRRLGVNEFLISVHQEGAVSREVPLRIFRYTAAGWLSAVNRERQALNECISSLADASVIRYDAMDDARIGQFVRFSGRVVPAQHSLEDGPSLIFDLCPQEQQCLVLVDASRVVEEERYLLLRKGGLVEACGEVVSPVASPNGLDMELIPRVMVGSMLPQ